MKIIKSILLLIIILLVIKVDFRLESDIYCCSDDFDYFSHAETIALDFDFDYSNQLEGYEKARYYKNDKIAPIGFVGAGLLASPFLLLGDLLDNLFEVKKYVNFKILIYSFSSIFYLLLTFVYLVRIKNKIYPSLQNKHLLLLLLGSGVTYYSFERYSMTHIYELFTITMICYFSLVVQEDLTKKMVRKYLFLLSFFIFLGFHVRWVNYFIFFIPYFVPKLLNKKKITFYKHWELLIYASFFVGLTLLLNREIYGVVTINPNYVYSSGVVNSVGDLFINFLESVKSFILIIFSLEFGIFYFSPIIFFGLLLVCVNFLTNPLRIENLLGLLIFLQVFVIVVLWKGTAASYGFRYLLCLTPLSLIVFFNFLERSSPNFSKRILKILIFLSIFSFISTIFFETTELTQLSLDEKINSFGKSVAYTQPEYLKGYIFSFFSLNAYLKILVTSFFGFLSFNLLFKIVNPTDFLNFIEQYSLNLNDQKVIDLLNKYAEMELSYVLVTWLLVSILFIKTKKILSESVF